MPLLDAALAFAVTMLAVATVVTKSVEFLHWLLANGPAVLKGLLRRFLGERQAMFKAMIGEFLDKEYQIVIRRVPQLDTPQLRQDLEDLKSELDSEDLVHLAGSDLITVVKTSKLWAAIQQDGNLPTNFLDFQRRYALVEAKYTTQFRANARLVATAIALGLALAFNIDSINILESYLVKPELSAAVSARSEAVLESYKVNLKALESHDPDAAKVFEQGRQELQQEMNVLTSSSFPFGWTYFPYGTVPPRSWSHSDQPGQPWRGEWTVWATWLIGIAFTAALAGLGAPFWYDVIRNLNEMARSSTASTTVETTVTATPPAGMVTQTTATTVVPGNPTPAPPPPTPPPPSPRSS